MAEPESFGELDKTLRISGRSDAKHDADRWSKLLRIRLGWNASPLSVGPQVLGWHGFDARAAASGGHSGVCWPVAGL